jgi:hypothetical protein
LERELAAYAEVRNQPVREMIADFKENLRHRLDAKCMERADSPRAVAWSLAHDALASLPTLDELWGAPPKRIIEVTTELLTLHVFAFEPLGELRLFMGVATFPGEAVDLRRRQAFVLLRMEDGTHFMTLDAFERAYEDVSEVERSFRIEVIRVRKLRGEAHFLSRVARAGEPS